MEDFVNLNLKVTFWNELVCDILEDNNFPRQEYLSRDQLSPRTGQVRECVVNSVKPDMFGFWSNVSERNGVKSKHRI